jgi:hypothetical protein
LSDKSFDFNRLNLPTPSQRSAESHKDLLNQVEQDLIGALQDVRALAKVIDL